MYTYDYIMKEVEIESMRIIADRRNNRDQENNRPLENRIDRSNISREIMPHERTPRAIVSSASGSATNSRNCLEISRVNPPALPRGGSLKKNTPKANFCVFCKGNNEPHNVVYSHVIKDKNNKVTCPQLFKHTCPSCGASGVNAHTQRHCPKKDSTYVSVPKAYAERSACGKNKQHIFTNPQY